MRAVSSGISRPTPGIFSCTSWPLTSTCGARPGEKIRSLILSADFTMAAISCGVGTVAVTAGVPAAANAAGIWLPAGAGPGAGAAGTGATGGWGLTGSMAILLVLVRKGTGGLLQVPV